MPQKIMTRYRVMERLLKRYEKERSPLEESETGKAWKKPKVRAFFEMRISRDLLGDRFDSAKNISALVGEYQKAGEKRAKLVVFNYLTRLAEQKRISVSEAYDQAAKMFEEITTAQIKLAKEANRVSAEAKTDREKEIANNVKDAISHSTTLSTIQLISLDLESISARFPKER